MYVSVCLIAGFSLNRIIPLHKSISRIVCGLKDNNHFNIRNYLLDMNIKF